MSIEPLPKDISVLFRPLPLSQYQDFGTLRHMASCALGPHRGICRRPIPSLSFERPDLAPDAQQYENSSCNLAMSSGDYCEWECQ